MSSNQSSSKQAESAPVAAIDIGTNSALLLIARASSKVGEGSSRELEVIEEYSRTPRLGFGLASDGKIREEGWLRACEVMEFFSQRMAAHSIGPERCRAVGTAIFRRASNADQVRSLLSEKLGRNLEVVSEEEEAELGFRAAVGEGALPGTLILDVGGGSSEVVAHNGRTRLSVPWGAVVASEMYLGLEGQQPREPGGWVTLKEKLVEAFRAFPENAAMENQVVLLGGTACNLGSLELGLEKFDHRQAEGLELPAERVLHWAEELERLNVLERRELPIEPDRSEVLPAGLLLIGLALARLGADHARITNRGLRYGVARALLG